MTLTKKPERPVALRLSLPNPSLGLEVTVSPLCYARVDRSFVFLAHQALAHYHHYRKRAQAP